ncbi:DNA-binding transcription factor cat8, partial [Oleoguttula sp. CCFEE 5521]
MPGILPMKVIKVGVNAQTRIAQACDRCRSKKIRCDGVRPCCSQCSNVGFECKTSDKLSRRAFPRGYTESLEERVRSLESEVRELKDLLDEKDEKIDMLSRIHSQSSYPIQLPSPRRPSVTPQDSATSKDEPDPDETFKVQQSPYLLGEGTDSYFAGTSSGRTFIEAFKIKVAESGRSKSDINTELLLASSLRRRLSDALSTPATPVVWKAPPRMVSDQLINIFFQEWAPMFPVLHKPTFLTLYEKYVADPDSVADKAEIAQLNLVFGVAALSSGTRASEDLSSFESQWKSALDTIINENCMATLQALILAQLYAIQLGDLTRLLTYKGLATSLSARLGLHQSQKRFALGTLTCETRKKVFWSLYTVDCFTSVILGLPKHIKNDDVHCEYPVDADDEYVTERGFQPTLPGESTRVSSALALFKAARILSKVLEEVFPAKASYDLSLKKLSELSDELDSWQSSLAPHLRLQF